MPCSRDDNYSPVLECIATSLADALTIEQAGGQRVELVSALREGGFTPSDGLARSVLASVATPVAVMLRPNRAGFHYSELDLEEMRRDALRFHELGVRHIVTGMLDESGIADIDTLEQLVQGTDFQVTFHRAIDECQDLAKSLERINACPRITHLLTSLGRGFVIDNLERLDWYAKHARPRLILASGITLKNVSKIAKAAIQFQADLHVGTALRHGNPMESVDPFAVQCFRDVLSTTQDGPSVSTEPCVEIRQRQTGASASLTQALREFQDARYGLFIHFGLYSMLGGTYKDEKTPFLAEWIRLTLNIPDEEYRALADQFDPHLFDADKLCRLARSWGMRYICLTAKHHDGFALFDSKADSFNSVTRSPAGRDYVHELAEACARHHLLFCLYYSQAQDWDHPSGLRAYRDPPSGEAFECYLKEKCLPQLRELLTQYGPVAMLWFDTPVSMAKTDCQRIKSLVRSLQPSCLISGRIGYGLSDYVTPGDNQLPRLSQAKLWELPATLNGSWGYRQNDSAWRWHKEVIPQLTKVTSRGGNLLLNVGPDGLGALPPSSIAILDQVGQFLNLHGDAYYETLFCPEYPYEQEDFLLTAKEGHLYLHLLRWPEQGFLELHHIENKPVTVTKMTTGEHLPMLVSTDLEGHAYWRIDLNPCHDTIRRDMARWGETVLDIRIQDDLLRISGF